jgi:hypothetical protein
VSANGSGDGGGPPAAACRFPNLRVVVLHEREPFQQDWNPAAPEPEGTPFLAESYAEHGSFVLSLGAALCRLCTLPRLQDLGIKAP